MVTDLVLQFFGAFCVTYRERPIVHFRTTKVQALLAYLTVEASANHPRHELMALLWPNYPLASAQLNLRQIIHQLRMTIPTVRSRSDDRDVPFILSGRHFVGINPDADYVADTTEFAMLVDDSRSHRHFQLGTCPFCRERLERAATVYQGAFLADFYLEDSNQFENWAYHRRAAYQCMAESMRASLQARRHEAPLTLV